MTSNAKRVQCVCCVCCVCSAVINNNSNKKEEKKRGMKRERERLLRAKLSTQNLTAKLNNNSNISLNALSLLYALGIYECVFAF